MQTFPPWRQARVPSLILALCFLCGCMLPPEEELLPPDLLQPADVTYRTMTVERGSIRNVLMEFCVAGSASLYDLTFHNRSGYLAELEVRPGQRVQKGDVLARLDTDSLEIDIHRQRLVIEKLRLAKEEADSVPDTSEYPSLRAEMDLQMARVVLRQKEDELRDLRSYEDDERDGRAIDALRREIERQRLEIQKLELAKEEIEADPDISTYPSLQAELDLNLARITLRQLEDEFSKATIVSPVDGEIVFLSDYNIGEFVPGRRVVMTVADPSQIQFEYTGSQSNRIKYGMNADITVGGIRVPATVSQTPLTVPLEDRERFRDTVIFTVEDLPEETRIGNRYEFNILLEEKDGVIVLPREVVSNFMGQYYVQVLEDGFRVERDLTVGVISSRELEVLSGVMEGETIITGIDN